ncbi:hypothetical protein Pcinc_003500 [Petrolisthes cinctipes]|uniref:Uncharacterized protein n=1 Tax=Petrolisthes cinctipes TaxID=88211 RepID=A0AAE1GGB3_PETCI|nr:hypothetical protein Pcinc_003500 [Petrolisthes cinctipes]
MCGVLRDARCVGSKVCNTWCELTGKSDDYGSDTRQQVRVVEQVSSHRESGKVARRQARQERVESAGPGEREVSETRCDRPF